MRTTTSLLAADLEQLLPTLAALYTDTHAHPELSMQETRTAGIAADRLEGAGYEETRDVGKTAMVTAAHAWLAA
jgi:hippurate hydrolase